MQSVEELYELKDFWGWGKYIPKQDHYIEFNANLVGAFFKVEDLINIYSNARFSLGLLEVNNYGELLSVHDENHLKFIRSRFIHDAMIYYNIAIDMAWQVIFFYVTDSAEYLLANHDEYRNHASRCNRGNLIELMKLYDETELKEVEDSFFNDECVREVRRIYNLYKHKSALHTRGLGKQYNNFMVGVTLGNTKVDLNMLTREEIEIEEMRTTLMNFDIKFFDFFSEVLRCITPENFDESINKSIFDMSHDSFNRLFKYAEKVRSYKENELDNYKRLFDIAYYDSLEVCKKEKIKLVDNASL